MTEPPLPSQPAASPVPDDRLVQRAGRGDRAALAELAGRYEVTLLGLARALLNGREDLAADAVQDAWLRVVRSGSAFSGASAVKTWLYRIVINRCHDLRAAHDQTARTLKLVDRRPHPVSADAEALVAAREAASAVQKAVANMKPEQRLIVILCYHAGVTHTQAAEILGIPVGTLKSRLHTILTELRSTVSAEHAPS